MNLYISPPFGNYLWFLGNTKCIYGSYTLEERHGLFKQIRKTLYYSKENQGWVNKIGLRNKGINYIIDKLENSFFSNIYKKDILSIALLKQSDVNDLYQKIPKNINLEVNISCPNMDKKLICDNIHVFLNRKYCSLKCSPLITTREIDYFYSIGFRRFHFSNTLPVQNGGLSGFNLIPYTSNLVRYTRETYKDDVYIIAGGGIDSMEQVLRYKECGADDVSVSSLCFNPFKFLYFYINFLYTKNFTNLLD